MPPRKIKKDPKADWLKKEDGDLVNPNTEEGLMMRGILKAPPKVEPFTAEVVPVNQSASMAFAPQPEKGVLLYKKLPGDCEVFKLHTADLAFPDSDPMVAVTCDSDDIDKVFESLLGDNQPPRYLNPKTGLEFEWTVPPPGFYGKPAGWDTPMAAEDLDDKE